MCGKVASNNSFMLIYCLDRYKAQDIRDKAIDDFLPTLGFVPDWFVTRMIKRLDDALFSNDDLIFVNKNSNYLTFFSYEMGITSVDIIDIKHDDVSFDGDDPKTTNHVRVMAWHNRFKQRKGFEKEI